MSDAGGPGRAVVASLGDRLARHRRPPWQAAVGSAWPLAAGLALAFAMQMVIAPAVGDYYGRIFVDVGIAIVLAVSLNIVNGYGGQFSLGHAGFMAVGGYTAAALVYYGSIRWFAVDLPNEPYGGSLGPGEWLLAGSCVAGGVTAAMLGFVVGLPSLRLKPPAPPRLSIKDHSECELTSFTGTIGAVCSRKTRTISPNPSVTIAR